MAERDAPRRDDDAAPGVDDAREAPPRRSPPAWDPGPRTGGDEGPRQSRRVFGREYRMRASSSQQWIFVGLALLFLVGYFLFRQSCVRRVSRTYGALTDQPRPDAGAARPRPPRPTMRAARPMGDPDDW